MKLMLWSMGILGLNWMVVRPIYTERNRLRTQCAFQDQSVRYYKDQLEEELSICMNDLSVQWDECSTRMEAVQWGHDAVQGDCRRKLGDCQMNLTAAHWDRDALTTGYYEQLNEIQQLKTACEDKASSVGYRSIFNLFS